MVNMLPSQRELRSGSMSKFSETQPLRTSSKFRKHRKRGPNPLSVKPAAGTKKKRPGPRLREALKAAAASKTSGHDSSIKTSSGLVLYHYTQSARGLDRLHIAG